MGTDHFLFINDVEKNHLNNTWRLTRVSLKIFLTIPYFAAGNVSASVYIHNAQTKNTQHKSLVKSVV